MILRFFGHASVGVTAQRDPLRGHKLLFDPYEPGGFGGQMAYPPIEFAPDDILITHTHLDHCHTAPFEGARVLCPALDEADLSSAVASRLGLRGLEVDHDAWLGRLRGGTTWILRVLIDGLSLVHLGDIGELPQPERLAQINDGRPVDVLLLTCGGFYTIGPTEAAELALRLGARLIIPIHTRTEACTLPHMEGYDAFLRHCASPTHHTGELEINPESMPAAGSVVVMGG